MAEPYAKKARQKAQPLVDSAVDFRRPEGAGCGGQPRSPVDSTRDHIVEDWLPKLSAAVSAVVAASEAAREKAEDVYEGVADKATDVYGTASEVGGRAPGAALGAQGRRGGQAARTQAQGRPRARRPGRAGAGISYLLNASPRTTRGPPPSPTRAGATSGSNGSVSDLRSRPPTPHDTAKDRASDVADTAKDKAADAAGDAKDKARTPPSADRPPPVRRPGALGTGASRRPDSEAAAGVL